MDQWALGKITIRVENQGNKDAQQISVRVGGSLVEDIYFQLVDPLRSGACFDIRFEVLPTKLEDNLKMQVEYINSADPGHVLCDFLALQIKARPQPHEIELDGAYKGDINILTPAHERLKLKVRDVITTRIKVNLDSTLAADQPELSCPEMVEKSTGKAQEPEDAAVTGHCSKCSRENSLDDRVCWYRGNRL